MDKMKANWRNYILLAVFTIAAVAIGIYAWVVVVTEIRWASLALAIALIAVGLGLNSLVISRRTDRKIAEIDEKLTQIHDLQKEIQKERQEQANSGPPLVASLQALSQYYMDYMAKQKGAGEPDK